MNYELAKELKEAGFPQSATAFGTFIMHPEETGPIFNHSRDMYAPTLEELIEACDGLNGLFSQLKRIAPERGSVEPRWLAYGGEFGEQGSTPTEAVARLWIALNKK